MTFSTTSTVAVALLSLRVVGIATRPGHVRRVASLQQGGNRSPAIGLIGGSNVMHADRPSRVVGLALALLAAFGLTAAAPAAVGKDTGLVFVSNEKSNSVVVLDPKS